MDELDNLAMSNMADQGVQPDELTLMAMSENEKATAPPTDDLSIMALDSLMDMPKQPKQTQPQQSPMLDVGVGPTVENAAQLQQPQRPSSANEQFAISLKDSIGPLVSEVSQMPIPVLQGILQQMDSDLQGVPSRTPGYGEEAAPAPVGMAQKVAAGAGGVPLMVGEFLTMNTALKSLELGESAVRIGSWGLFEGYKALQDEQRTAGSVAKGFAKGVATGIAMEGADVILDKFPKTPVGQLLRYGAGTLLKGSALMGGDVAFGGEAPTIEDAASSFILLGILDAPGFVNNFKASLAAQGQPTDTSAIKTLEAGATLAAEKVAQNPEAAKTAQDSIKKVVDAIPPEQVQIGGAGERSAQSSMQPKTEMTAVEGAKVQPVKPVGGSNVPPIVKELMDITEKINAYGDKAPSSLLKRRDALQTTFDTYLSNPNNTPSPGIKHAIRTLTGQIKVSELVPETAALKGRMKGEQVAGRAGYKLGVAETLAEVKEKAQFTRLQQLAKTEMKGMLRDIQRAGESKGTSLEYRDLINEIKGGLDLKQRSGKTMMRRYALRDYVNGLTAQGEDVSNIPMDKLELLEKTAISDMTIEELRGIHSTVTRLEHLGKIKNKLITTQQNRTFASVVNEQVQTITGGKPIEPTTAAERGLAEAPGVVGRAKDSASSYLTRQMRPELIIKTLDRGKWDGINHQTMFKPLNDAANAKIDGIKNSMDTLSKIMDDSGVDIIKIERTSQDIDGFKVTPNQAMDVYANTFNKHNLDVLRNSGLTDSNITNIVASLTPQQKTVVQKTISFFDRTQWTRMEDVYAKLYGEHLGKVDGYWPIKGLEQKSSSDAIKLDIEQRFGLRKATGNVGELTSRVEHGRGIEDYDFFWKLHRTVADQEHFIAMGQPVRDVSKVLYNPQIKEAIRNAEQLPNGEMAYEVLDKWLRDVSYGRDQNAATALDRTAKTLTANFAVAVLGANFNTLALQPTAAIQGAYMIGPKSTAIGLVNYLKHPVEAWKFANEKSSLIRNRMGRTESYMGTVLEQQSSASKFGQHTLKDKATDVSLFGVQIADKSTAVILWNSAYDKAIKLGQPESKAIQYADMAIRRTQNISGPVHLPDSMRGGAGSSVYMLFKNQLNNNSNLLIDAGLDSQFTDKVGIARGADAATKLAYAYIATVGIPAALSGVIQRRRLPNSPGEVAEDQISMAADGYYMLGNISRTLMKAARGGGWSSGWEMAPAPIAGPVQEAAKGISGIASGASVPVGVGHIGVAAGSVLGIPASGTARKLLPKKSNEREGYEPTRGSGRVTRGLGRASR